MRIGWAGLLLVGCVGRPAVDAEPEPTVEPLVERVVDFPPSTEFRVWPGVELVPENGLTLRARGPEPIVLGQHDFSIFRVDGDKGIEVVGALETWHWNEGRTEVRLEPRGLQRGAPYLLVGRGLITDSGRAIPAFGHRFRVIPPDETPPDGTGVRVLGDPRPGTGNGLTITFPEAVRRDVTRKVTALAGGMPHSGEWALSADQRTLRFTPAEPWPDSLVVVSMNAGIRDLGGNELVNRPQGMLTPLVPVRP